MTDDAPPAAEPGTLGQLLRLGTEAEAAVGRLLEKSGVHYYNINAGSGAVFDGANAHRWDQLDGPGQYALGQARVAVDMWVENVERAVAVGAPERLGTLTKHQTLLAQVLRREGAGAWQEGAPGGSVGDIRILVQRAFDAARTLVTDLPTANGPGGSLYVPDTNALVFEPALEKWRLPTRPAALVFVPQVIRELDEKKNDARIGEKATSVVRRLKEYGRRGDTFDGVPLAGDVSVREVGHQTSTEDALNWLDAANADDRLLASVLGLKWADLRYEVTLITRDRNLQNKARLAQVACLDVEDITGGD